MNHVDTRKLIAGLRQYLTSLEKHIDDLKKNYQKLDNSWHSFKSVSEGNYVDQFRSGWQITQSQFQEYVNHSEKIKQFLIEHLDDLVEFDAERMSLGEKFDWDISKQDWDKFNQIRQTLKQEEKTGLSKEQGEIFGHKLVTEKLGYKNEMPGYGRLVAPDSKYDSMCQGFDGVYYDDKTDEIVVAEFKGQDSKPSDDQKLDNWVPDVCQKIINAKFPYYNASQEERDLAYKIQEECQKGNVRYELYRTKFDSDSSRLYTQLEDIKYPCRQTNLKNILNKIKLEFKPGIISRNPNYIQDKEEILRLLQASNDEISTKYEQQEARKLLKEKLFDFYDNFSGSEQLSKRNKKKLDTLLEKILLNTD